MRTICFFVLTMTALQVTPQQYQWRGPDRDGHYNETGLLKVWPEEGPELVFSVVGIGAGYSSAVKAGNTIYITGKIDTLDYLTAIDIDGRVKWQKPYGRSWTGSFPETRSTPTVEEDRLYVISGTGEMVCLNT